MVMLLAAILLVVILLEDILQVVILLEDILLVVTPLEVMADQATMDTVLDAAHNTTQEPAMVVIMDMVHLFPTEVAKDFHIVHIFLMEAVMDMFPPFPMETAMVVACITINFNSCIDHVLV